jgi:hypothetical protein
LLELGGGDSGSRQREQAVASLLGPHFGQKGAASDTSKQWPLADPQKVHRLAPLYSLASLTGAS